MFNLVPIIFNKTLFLKISLLYFGLVATSGSVPLSSCARVASFGNPFCIAIFSNDNLIPNYKNGTILFFDPSITPYWWDLTTENSDIEDEGYLLQESGGKILQETGDGILIDSENIVTQVINFPVSAIRTNVTTISAGGAVTFIVLQAGMPGQ